MRKYFFKTKARNSRFVDLKYSVPELQKNELERSNQW